MAKHKRTSKSASDAFVFVPLGGVGEIGMNLYLYGLGEGHDRQWLMVDLGITFPGERDPGVDVIMPDIRFIEQGGRPASDHSWRAPQVH